MYVNGESDWQTHCTAAHCTAVDYQQQQQQRGRVDLQCHFIAIQATLLLFVFYFLFTRIEKRVSGNPHSPNMAVIKKVGKQQEKERDTKSDRYPSTGEIVGH